MDTPYNYCDYRCDRCDERLDCRVFREEQARLQEHYDRGEDPYDPEIFMADLKRIFQQTEAMIIHAAEQENVNLEDNDEIPVREEPEQYVLYRQAFEYRRQAKALIRLIEADQQPDTIREAFADLIWYHTLIAAKAGRLVSGFIDHRRSGEFQKKEEEGTLAVISKCILLSRQGLERIKTELPEHTHLIKELLAMLDQIEQTIQTDIRRKIG